MVELKEKQIEKIKNATDNGELESVIDLSIAEMKKNGLEEYRIAHFIRQLDISLLLLEPEELTKKQWHNIKWAQKILFNKIINGSSPDFIKTN